LDAHHSILQLSHCIEVSKLKLMKLKLTKLKATKRKLIERGN
jgi:hypothetical protein